jgi:hypothetical protein
MAGEVTIRTLTKGERCFGRPVLRGVRFLSAVDGIDALPQQFPCLSGSYSGLIAGDRTQAAKTHLASDAAEHVAENPPLCPGGINFKPQSSTITMTARLRIADRARAQFLYGHSPASPQMNPQNIVGH